MLDSCFTLTFAVEVLVNEESSQNDNVSMDWTELGPCTQGLKLHYTLYQGYTYDLDVLMWSNAGKIWCGNQYGWVRTWQFFNKHWMVFTIRHKFPVKVEEFRQLEIVIVPTVGVGSFGTNARNDKDFLILIPPLEFGELRYFGKIVEKEDEGIINSIINSIWTNVVEHIPASCFDGSFDTPQLVTDVRHQDAILGFIRETTLTSNLQLNNIDSVKLSHLKDKGKRTSPESESYKLKINGEVILAGSGKLNRFLEVGYRSTLQGRVLAVVGSSNLPAQDDLPIMFVNIKNLDSIPIDEFQKAGIHQIYTRWNAGKVEHDSVLQNVTSDTKVLFNDNYVIPIEKSLVFDVFNALIDNGFDIQLRGKRKIEKKESIQNLFSAQSSVTPFGSLNVDIVEDILIGATRIDVRELSKGSNKVISGEFSLYPKQTYNLHLKSDCTNYINDISSIQKNKIGFQSHIILNSQMMLDVSVGLLGCEISLSKCFSRLYALAETALVAYDVLENIDELNQRIYLREKKLTGFYLDTGDKHFIFVEGEKNKDIIKLWEEIETYYPNVRCYFSSSDTYLERIYPEMVNSERPFYALKMRVPLSSLLACPSVYALPALPLPSRRAMIKISQILSGKLNQTPSRREMPTASELRSFKLELCAPLRSYIVGDISFAYKYD